MHDETIPEDDPPDVVTALALDAAATYARVLALGATPAEAWKAVVTEIQTALHNWRNLAWDTEMAEEALEDEQARLGEAEAADGQGVEHPMETWPKSYTFRPLIPVLLLRYAAQELGLEEDPARHLLTFDVSVEVEISEAGEVTILRCLSQQKIKRSKECPIAPPSTP